VRDKLSVPAIITSPNEMEKKRGEGGASEGFRIYLGKKNRKFASTQSLTRDKPEKKANEGAEFPTRDASKEKKCATSRTYAATIESRTERQPNIRGIRVEQSGRESGSQGTTE